jgi:hypothetical protein
MTAKGPPETDFMAVLEKGVRDVLKAKESTSAERMSAITAGAKLLMIKHKISGSDVKGFFD